MEVTCDWNFTNSTTYMSGPYKCIYLENCRISAIIYGVLSCAGLLANVIALLGMCLLHKKETGVLFLFSLSLADFISPLFQMITVAEDPLCDATFRRVWLKEPVDDSKRAFGLFIFGMQMSAYYAVLLTSFAMASDRLIAITMPFRHRSVVTKTRVVVTLSSLWVLSIVLGFLAFFNALTITTTTAIPSESEPSVMNITMDNFTRNATVSIDYLTAVRKSIALTITVLFGVACFVFVVLVVVYSVIFHQIRNHQKFAAVSAKQQVSSAKSAKSVVTSLLIVGSFAVCWLPSSITFMVNNYSPSMTSQEKIKTPDSYSNILDWASANFALVLLNPIVDPIIYVSRNAKIRKALWIRLEPLVFCCRCRSRRQGCESGKRSTELTNIVKKRCASAQRRGTFLSSQIHSYPRSST